MEASLNSAALQAQLKAAEALFQEIAGAADSIDILCYFHGGERMADGAKGGAA